MPSLMRQEIQEQQALHRRILVDRAAEAEEITSAWRSRDFRLISLVGRGSSDHAALYAQYLFGLALRIPCQLATPSLVTRYGAPPRLDRALVIGLSQSGAAADVAEVLDNARAQGATTIALTNVDDSPVARAAETAIQLGCGPEESVAATKTYTAQLAWMLSLALAASGARAGRRRDLADQLDAAHEAALQAEDSIAAAADSRSGADRALVVGRGLQYATAREVALKLKELALIFADPYSAADLLHGPVVLARAEVPLLAFATKGAVLSDLRGILERLANAADVVTITDQPDLARSARFGVLLPDVDEWAAPLVAVVPGQLFAMHLALAKGFEVDSPAGLSKVTVTH